MSELPKVKKVFGGVGLKRIKNAMIGVAVAGSLAIPLLHGTVAQASVQSISPLIVPIGQTTGALLLTPHVASPGTVSWHYSHSSHSSHASHYSHYSSRY